MAMKMMRQVSSISAGSGEDEKVIKDLEKALTRGLSARKKKTPEKVKVKKVRSTHYWLSTESFLKFSDSACCKFHISSLGP